MTAATVFLGLDAGGSQTRWALVDAQGAVMASGVAPGFSALQWTQESARVREVMDTVAQQVLEKYMPTGVVAGITGLGGAHEPVALALQEALAQALQLQAWAVRVGSDLEVAYLDAFAPGEGYLVYAGTGSVAVHMTASGELHRAGGRGGVLDDGGSGFWIAREALRHIWRREDESPGAWHSSTLAQQVFAHIGGSDWATSRQFVYAGSRGAMGELALVVAACAQTDAMALDILQRAGAELARLARALVARLGDKPVALGGRVALLHPVITESLRSALPAQLSLKVVQPQAHIAAARQGLKHLLEARAAHATHP